MRVVIFGTGKFYQKRKEELLSDREIERVAMIDNDASMHGTYVDGVPVLAVDQIASLTYDRILLMSVKADEMKLQLTELGVEGETIWYWKRFLSEKLRGTFYFHRGNLTTVSGEKKVLIITESLGYTGGALAAVYAAEALQSRGYRIVLAAPEGNPVFVDEMKNRGLDLVICPALPYLHQEELAFIDLFDLVIVNVFPMILCAAEISRRKPVVWWIHEASDFYHASLIRFCEYAEKEKLENMDIYAVSRIAQENFNHYFPGRITKTLAYGIPDERGAMPQKTDDRIVFAVIGGVTPRKAQDIFVKAVKKLRLEYGDRARFLVIGTSGQDPYSMEVKKMASDSSIEFLGELTREEIKKAFQDIDVLVCPSREDPLPIVVTEAMMYGKTCIVSDSVGMADHIEDGENGFVFRKDDADALAERMTWVFRNQNRLAKIGKNARKVYEECFTMDCFGQRLEDVLRKWIS